MRTAFKGLEFAMVDAGVMAITGRDFNERGDQRADGINGTQARKTVRTTGVASTNRIGFRGIRC